MEIIVNTYVANVFLSVFKNFKKLSIIFKKVHRFLSNHTYILSYKMKKKTRDFTKNVDFNCIL